MGGGGGASHLLVTLKIDLTTKPPSESSESPYQGSIIYSILDLLRGLIGILII